MLERAEELSITVEHKVPAMEVECSERERGETLLTAEHLKITGILISGSLYINPVIENSHIVQAFSQEMFHCSLCRARVRGTF